MSEMLGKLGQWLTQLTPGLFERAALFGGFEVSNALPHQPHPRPIVPVLRAHRSSQFFVDSWANVNELDEDLAEPLRPRGEELIEEVGILRRTHPGHAGVERFRWNAGGFGDLVEHRGNDLKIDPAG